MYAVLLVDGTILNINEGQSKDYEGIAALTSDIIEAINLAVELRAINLLNMLEIDMDALHAKIKRLEARNEAVNLSSVSK